jgi:glycosyltransferase involved in cell wall biosynthesis
LMEAVSSGVPVVATAVSEIPNLLTNGSDALLVPPEEPGALAEAITEVARDPALRRRLAAAALRLADRFDIERCVREVESIYDQLQPQPAPLTQ